MTIFQIPGLELFALKVLKCLPSITSFQSLEAGGSVSEPVVNTINPTGLTFAISNQYVNHIRSSVFYLIKFLV